MPDTTPYDDILDLPHPTSRVHPRLSREKRAAQFAPFAALTGFETALAEAEIAHEKETFRPSDGDTFDEAIFGFPMVSPLRIPSHCKTQCLSGGGIYFGK